MIVYSKTGKMYVFCVIRNRLIISDQHTNNNIRLYQDNVMLQNSIIQY